MENQELLKQIADKEKELLDVKATNQTLSTEIKKLRDELESSKVTTKPTSLDYSKLLE